ncbi:hypothetical protein HPB51_021863 [Rhipicephalus microplus]|uniref:Uncharacterized protein n=1 Tax=Rhipicephalus microplus TaxID=6941 RepID=A0A9J6DD59_RHIMP|nr:hypothetical protein HPB51_021863 [Rhipicephalus microplus]
MTRGLGVGPVRSEKSVCAPLPVTINNHHLEGQRKEEGGISWPPAGAHLCVRGDARPEESPQWAPVAHPRAARGYNNAKRDSCLPRSASATLPSVGTRRSPRGVSVSFRGQQNEPRGTSIRNSRGGNRARFKATRNHIGRTRNCRSTQPKRGQPTAEGPSFPSKGAPGKTIERSRGISKTSARERKALFMSRLEFTRDSDIATKEARLPSLEFRNPFLERRGRDGVEVRIRYPQDRHPLPVVNVSPSAARVAQRPPAYV